MGLRVWVQDARKSKMKMLDDLMCGLGFSLLCRWYIRYTAEDVANLWHQAFFLRLYVPSRGLHCHDPVTSHKVLLTRALEIRLQHKSIENKYSYRNDAAIELVRNVNQFARREKKALRWEQDRTNQLLSDMQKGWMQSREIDSSIQSTSSCRTSTLVEVLS